MVKLLLQQNASGAQSMIVNIAKYKPGTYILQVKNDAEVSQQKIIKILIRFNYKKKQPICKILAAFFIGTVLLNLPCFLFHPQNQCSLFFEQKH